MLITSLSAGEISKKLFGRVDLAIYQQAAEHLLNWNVIPTGGITRRTGSRRHGALAGPARMIPFIINPSTSFLLEIGVGYIRIWKNGELVKNGETPIQFTETAEMPLPSSLSEAREVQYAQNYNEFYFVHRNIPPYKISWLGGTAFTLERLVFTGNVDEVPFQGTDYPGVITFFNGRMILGSTYLSPQKIWASRPFKYTDFTTFDTVTTESQVLKEVDLHVFTASAHVDCIWIYNVSQDFSDIDFITNVYYVTGPGVPIGTIADYYQFDGGIRWLHFRGTTHQISEEVTDGIYSIQRWKIPDTPTAEDYETLTITNDVTSEDNAFVFEIASDKNDSIKWLATQDDLIIGTESSEWVVPKGSTALNYSATLQTRTGAEPFQATVVGDAVVFIQQGGRSIREYFYNSNIEAYQCQDLVVFAEQILRESPAVDFDYTNSPVPRILVTRADGAVSILCIEKTLSVLAWSRIALSSGLIRSTATVPDSSGFDTMFFSVQAGDEWSLESISEDDTVFLDGYTEYEGSIAGYDTPAVLYNSTTKAVCPIEAIPEGFITVGDSVFIGYEYESLMRSLPVINSYDNNKKRIVGLIVRFLESYLPDYSSGDTNYQIITKAEPFSGVVDLVSPGNFDNDVFFWLRATKPESCTVLAVSAKVV